MLPGMAIRVWNSGLEKIRMTSGRALGGSLVAVQSRMRVRVVRGEGGGSADFFINLDVIVGHGPRRPFRGKESAPNNQVSRRQSEDFIESDWSAKPGRGSRIGAGESSERGGHGSAPASQPTVCTCRRRPLLRDHLALVFRGPLFMVCPRYGTT